MRELFKKVDGCFKELGLFEQKIVLALGFSGLFFSLIMAFFGFGHIVVRGWILWGVVSSAVFAGWVIWRGAVSLKDVLLIAGFAVVFALLNLWAWYIAYDLLGSLGLFDWVY